MNRSRFLVTDFTSDEIDACTHYSTDATFIHATLQGRSGDFEHNPEFLSFRDKARKVILSLDSAVAKSILSEKVVLYSGHGNGLAAVGSIRMEANRYKHLRYKYPGFISTSTEREVAEDFLTKRGSSQTFPVLLEIHLTEGECALDMSAYSHAPEFEILIPRNIELEISSSAEIVVQGLQVLHLVLESPKSKAAA